MLGIFCREQNVKEIERRIRANNPEYNAQFKYANNYISTSKYNVFTFLPKNLFEQFRRIANAYFLFLLILQLIPEISSLTPLTTIVPLAAVLIISALKDAVDDAQRHRSDNQVNNRLTWLLRDGHLVEEKWRQVSVGDIVKMQNNQFVAADILLLSTSEPNSLCYIETAELDGETNLKVRQALPETAKMEDNILKLSTFDGEVLCEPPNNVLSKFQGRLSWLGETYSLDNDKVLLRGCRLRNTQWCYGLVIFAGKDTKLMMNCGETTFKRTHIDRLMNFLIIGIFVFLLCTCLVCAICCAVWEVMVGNKFQIFLPWENFVPGSPGKAGTAGGGSVVIAILIFFSYIIVLNTVVPISLYVSVEMIRMGHSWWIDWDSQMYDASKDTPARSRTTTLNEELGQIEYIFSDKTGTLTQNVMTFNKCSIGGKSYGDPVDEQGIAHDVTTNTPLVNFMSDNPMADPQFQFYDDRLWQMSRQGDEDVQQFFRLLSLCHTVMPEEKDGSLIYQAQSPDEGALVNAARNFGFVFKSRTPNTITIEAFGEEEVYELLCILDFNNVRKRMSVILKKDGCIRLYCKGADSTIFERLDRRCNNLKELTTSHLNDFAQDGLRTLCLAVKDIDSKFYQLWKKKHHEASTALQDRDDLLDALYEEIEKDMVLVGASAIEDKLQDGVPDAIANLALAGIKIWVLTGDKQETAINIGYSCRLLTEDMEEVFVIDGEDFEEVEKQLTSAKKEMEDKAREAKEAQTKVLPVSKSSEPLSSGQLLDFAIVINGPSLAHALTERLEMVLLEVGCQCKAVICCRVTPLQKALVVELVKKHKKSVTLAIGDGANDVSMIKAAHIGVGISGQEGMQAVLASDFSFAQFRFLERLLLVHGRWSYLRMAKFLRYFFYKNFAFTLCHFWFAFFCGFSAQTIYDEAFVSLYNVCYTSLPVLALAIFEQDVNDKLSLLYPKLYTPGQRDLFFNKKVFALSVAEGIGSSLVLYLIPYLAFKDTAGPNGIDIAGHRALGFVVASILIVVVTLRCALETTYWTAFNHVVIWGSIIFYFIFIIVFYSDPIGYSYQGVALTLMSTSTFWFSMALSVIVLLVPVIAEQFYRKMTRPTLTDRVRLTQKRSRAAVSSNVRIIRRASSSLRRSQRSIRRSGYAFAHQQGFGSLITTGSMMHLKSNGPEGNARQPAWARAVVSVGGLTAMTVLPEQDLFEVKGGTGVAETNAGFVNDETSPTKHRRAGGRGPITVTAESSLEQVRLTPPSKEITGHLQTGSGSESGNRPRLTSEKEEEEDRRRSTTTKSHSPINLELQERTDSQALEEINLASRVQRR